MFLPLKSGSGAFCRCTPPDQLYFELEARSSVLIQRQIATSYPKVSSTDHGSLRIKRMEICANRSLQIIPSSLPRERARTLEDIPLPTSTHPPAPPSWPPRKAPTRRRPQTLIFERNSIEPSMHRKPQTEKPKKKKKAVSATKPSSLGKNTTPLSPATKPSQAHAQPV